MHISAIRQLATAAIMALAVTAAPATAIAAAPSAPATNAKNDPFYIYDGSKPLSSFAPGAVLKTRTLPYHVVGIPTPVKAIQLLYRTTDAQGRPSVGVTSVVRSPGGDGRKAVSYQSFYDSLSAADGPSRGDRG
ncbi:MULTISPECIES: hypothetical protein [Streptomyces]|uniref:hypothetical protein n=1 Tax=Streptomyces TaxID=1883 RepID=UPI00345C3DC0